MSKEKNNAFAACHPLVNFAFYLFIIVYTILLMHPVYIGISFVFSLVYALMLTGKGTLKFLLFLLPMMALIIILNPLFNHYGSVPPLFYLGDNPVTKEAFFYGVTNAFMLAAVLLWFVSFNRIISSDKFIYLFGRIIPKIALILSMALRLIPKMKGQIKIIANAQNMIGKGMRGGGLFRKIKHGLKIVSILVTWSLENGIETSDSMKARGYGSRRRTSFTLYRFYRRDRLLLPSILALAALCIAGMALGATFFPYRILAPIPWGPLNIAVTAGFGFCCILPIAIELKERISWHYSLSKI